MNTEELKEIIRNLQFKLICEKAESQSRESKLKAQLGESKAENEQLRELLESKTEQKTSRKRGSSLESVEEEPKSKKPKVDLEEKKCVMECTICIFPYDSDYHFPHVLDCGHSLCKTCLHILEDQDVKLYGQSEFRCVNCPSCKTNTYRRLNEDFLKNYALVPHSV